MQYRNLGRSGLKVSRICLGMMSYGDTKWRPWVLDEQAGHTFVARALEAGINFFDTADMYSDGVSEEITGRTLRAVPRTSVVVATKCYMPMGPGPNDRGLSRKHILDSIDASLRRLGMDYVDLYQIHRYDPTTPIEETMEALHDIVRAGKARYIGASSMYAWQFAQMQHVAERHNWTKFISMQNHYNLAYREEEREMIPFCQATGVGCIPWSPLARGLLARGVQAGTLRGDTDTIGQAFYTRENDIAIAARVGEVAERLGVSAAQVALAWLLQQPAVTAPIIGATKPHHLEDALAAVDLTLSSEDLAALAELYQPHPVLGHS